MSPSPPRVPFNRPSLVGNELRYIEQAVRGGQLAGDGPFTRRCEDWLRDYCGAQRVLLTHSCTAALEIAILLCGVEPEDEVVMPSFTFVSTANAVVLRGARPVFVDIGADTLNIDERSIAAALGQRTRVIMPVHYAGVACRMGPILDLAESRDLRVVEDAAQGLGSSYRGRALGSLGQLGCWSFHETKNFISGEGGALVLRDSEFIERAEMLREKGTNRAAFLRAEVAKYTWVDVGSSYAPSELVAAFLLAQLERWDEIMERRLEIFGAYERGLDSLARRGAITLPTVPADCRHNGHMFYVLAENEGVRDSLLTHLAAAGVNAVFHYVPLHESPMGRRLGYARGDFPVTESVSRRLIRLPCFFSMTAAQQDLVVREMHRFFDGATASS